MKLYFTPGACSLAPHLILEELGLAHELEQVDLKTKKTQRGHDYLAINHKGYVPALQLNNGQLLTEVVAICEYLADQKPEAHLIPATGAARYQLLSLMVYIATEIHKPMGALFDPNQPPEARRATEALLTKRLDWLTETMGDNEFVFGTHFSIADAYLFTILNWTNIVKFDLSPWPGLQTFCQVVAKRPAIQKTLKLEGLI